MAQLVSVTSPVGRIVMGSLYKANTTDADGKPLTIKTGPNAGQPTSKYFFALAIPKLPNETHFAHTAWGRQIWDVGCAAFPQASQAPSFAWKVEDGDSQVPNKKGRKPVDNEGWPGHWILKFSGGFAPKVYEMQNGVPAPVLAEDYVKPGYYVQVAFNVAGNGSQQNPGVYVNPSMVCLRGFGPEINFGPDVMEAGFGQQPLPAGASLVPLAGTMPAALPAPGAVAPLPTAAQALPPVSVLPIPQFLNVGTLPVPAAAAGNTGIASIASPSSAPPPPAAAAPAPPVPSGPSMTAKANGVSYAAFLGAGWTDANLIAQGYMLPR